MPLQMQKKANPKGSRTPSVQRLKARKKKGSALADVRTPPKRGADDAVPPSLSHMRLSFPYLIRSACAHGPPITPRCEPYAPATSPSLSLLFPKAPSLTWNGTLGFTQGQVAVVQAEDCGGIGCTSSWMEYGRIRVGFIVLGFAQYEGYMPVA
jgi:hypothetical protein